MLDDGSTSNDSPPQVRIAAACERVLEERDGTISLIRIIDQFTIILTSRQADAEGPKAPIRKLGLHLVLSTIAADARGPRTVFLKIVRPSGQSIDGPSLETSYDRSTDLRNWVVALSLTVGEAGVYWIEWHCSGTVLTRLPLHIRYERRTKSGDAAE